MATIASNPSQCCTTCADFPDCEICGDGVSLITLSIEIEGAPADTSFTCEDCYATGCRGKGRTLWKNIEGSYQLEQDPLAKDTFRIEFATCENVRGSSAKLVEDSESGSCFGPVEESYLILDGQTEVYVSAISVRLACADNRMQIAEITFSFCSCSRPNVGRTVPPTWGAWECNGIDGYPSSPPFLPYNLICDLADQLATARPCSAGRMEREIVWPAITAADCAPSCGNSFDCNSPVVGKLSAQLSC